jgi:hypothetical protein
MKKISLDANAVLDFCYRFYGNEIFTKLWDDLEASVIAKQICFFITPSILQEINFYISQHDLDSNKFDSFVSIYKVEFPKTDEFGSSTIALKKLLLSYKAAQNSPHVNRDNYGDADIVSFAKSVGGDAIVLTSETVFKLLDWNNPKHNNHIKVPNLCELSGVECLNWFGLLDYLGQKY